MFPPSRPEAHRHAASPQTRECRPRHLFPAAALRLLVMVLGRIHGTLVSVHAWGVLLRGPSGVGKSLAALGVMGRGHYLVADDIVEVYRERAGGILGRALEKDARIEVRGLGVVAAHALFEWRVLPSAPIDLVINLDRYDPFSDAGRIEPQVGCADIFGFTAPQVRLALPDRADPGLLVETATRLILGKG